MTTDQLMQQLVAEKGAIVTSGECSGMEVCDAQATGRFAVREDGIGFVRRCAEWLEHKREYMEYGYASLQDELGELRRQLSHKTQTCTIAEGTIQELRHRIESLETDNLIYSTQRKKDQESNRRFAEAVTLLHNGGDGPETVARLREIILHND